MAINTSWILPAGACVMLLIFLIAFVPLLICLVFGHCDADQRVGTTGLHSGEDVRSAGNSPPAVAPVIRVVVNRDLPEERDASAEPSLANVMFEDQGGRPLSHAQLRQLICAE